MLEDISKVDIRVRRNREIRTPEDVLSVGVDVKVQSDALAVTEGVHLCHEPLVFRRVARSQSLVCLRARRGRCSASNFPLVGPVAVDVATNTAAGADGLAVLAPETVGCLGVDEACKIGISKVDARVVSLLQ